jgi:hypothetical protein
VLELLQGSLPTCSTGFPAGFPADLLDSYPVLKDFRNSVAAVTEITAFFRWVGGASAAAVHGLFTVCSNPAHNFSKLPLRTVALISANCFCALSASTSRVNSS